MHVLMTRAAALAAALLLAAACGSSSTSDTPDGGNAEGGVEGGSSGSSSSGDGGSSGALTDGGDGGNAEAGDGSAGGSPTMPVLTNLAGGPILTTPKVQYVFYPGYPFEADLKTFAQKVAASTYWSTTTSEYGVGALTYSGTTDLTGQTPPTTIKSTDLATWFSSELTKGTFGTPDSQTLYTIV